MVTALTIFHLVVCIFLVIVVLLQHGKGADMGATFGGASNTVFGAGGATTVLSKITIGAAVVFMINCLALAYLSSSGASKSLMEGEKGKVQVTPVASPAASASPAAAAAPTVVPTKAPAQKK